MINKLVDVFIYILDWVYTLGTVHEYFEFWDTLTGYIADYRFTLTNLLEGIYFFVGKTLVVFVWDFSIAVFCLAIIFAIVNLIGQFVP
jgi:hypothetical protein